MERLLSSSIRIPAWKVGALVLALRKIGSSRVNRTGHADGLKYIDGLWLPRFESLKRYTTKLAWSYGRTITVFAQFHIP